MQDWIIDIAKQFKGNSVTDRMVQSLISEIEHLNRKYDRLEGENIFFKRMLKRVPPLGEKYGIEDLALMRNKLHDIYLIVWSTTCSEKPTEVLELIKNSFRQEVSIDPYDQPEPKEGE